MYLYSSTRVYKPLLRHFQKPSCNVLMVKTASDFEKLPALAHARQCCPLEVKFEIKQFFRNPWLLVNSVLNLKKKRFFKKKNIVAVQVQCLYIIHPCDPTVVICYLIWPCDIAACITYLISHSSSLSYNTVFK